MKRLNRKINPDIFKKMGKSSTVKGGNKVTLSYLGKLEDGTIFDENQKSPFLTCVVGSGFLLSSFESHLIGMVEKEKKNFQISPKDAYGLYDENLIIEVPISKFPLNLDLHIGMLLKIPLKKLKQNYPVKIIGISDISITLDANHPLAGETLFFEVEILEIIIETE